MPNALVDAEIVVIGSANADLVATSRHIPAPGETVLGDSFRIVAGGKGANQAVAAARLGGRVAFVGRVGDDAFGRTLAQGLQDAHVDCTHLQSTSGVETGVALIVISNAGENAICVVAGANRHLTPADIDAAEETIAAARVCLLQLEIPLETALHTIALARRLGVETILDPAPAPAAAPAGLFHVDILSPNQSEAVQLLGADYAPGDPSDVAQALRQRGGRTIVLKRGADGAYLSSGSIKTSVPGFRVDAVDTTAAGDAFTAALGVARVEGMSLESAVRFANAAGALACTKLGAQPALPARAQVTALLES